MNIKNSGLEELLKHLMLFVALPLSCAYMLLALICFPFPINYVMVLVPLVIASKAYSKEENRQLRLGYVHDRVREISQDRMEKAKEDLINEFKRKRESEQA